MFAQYQYGIILAKTFMDMPLTLLRFQEQCCHKLQLWSILCESGLKGTTSNLHFLINKSHINVDESDKKKKKKQDQSSFVVIYILIVSG